MLNVETGSGYVISLLRKKFNERCEMARKTHHVVPNPSGGWSVKKGGDSRASKTFDKMVTRVRSCNITKAMPY
jgi:hypothetical protein